MKIALTGAGGMLGHAIKRVFSDIEIVSFTHDVLDVTSLDDAVKKVKDANPDFLIHAAAFTDVDRCEFEPEKAYLVNGIGTRNMAIACEEIKCPVIYISSDYVFDGSKGGPYDEWDIAIPVNKYGLSKLMGERFVSLFNNRFYIIRTSWLYGKNGRNFVDTILKLLSEKERIEVVSDQVGCPTYTVDLAGKIREITGKGYGIYHVTNSGSCSWYDLAVMIASKKNFKNEIVPITADKLKRPAGRPAFSVLGNTMLRLEGIEELRNWDEALEEYLG
ncbi:MAG: dTDP-4-dehydrorhamnose reductase [Nitrospirota bacterium]